MSALALSDQLMQLLFTGLTLGSVYALMALALVITFNITGILNLAQGEFTALGALIAISIYNLGLPLPAILVISSLLVALLGGLVERCTIHPARKASGLSLIIITIGVSISLRGLALLIWGTDTYALPAFSPGGPLQLGGGALTRQSLWIFALTALVMVSLYVFFELTYWGKAVKACVINRTAARLQGINPGTVSFFAFMSSGALGAAAGIFIAPLTMATYDMGFMLGMKGFVAAVIGGLSHVSGAVLGGILLGILESFSAGLISSGSKDAIAMIILLAVLLIRPKGLITGIRERKI